MLYAGTCSCQYEWPGTGSNAASMARYNQWAAALPSTVVVPPAVEPLTFDEVKLDRRVTHNLDDALLTAWIQAAREYCEGYLGASLVTQTREVNVPLYVEGMALPYGPVQSVTVPPETEAPFTVQYVAGYPPTEDVPPDYAANVPASIKVAMKLLIGNWYENREAVVVGTTNAMLELGVRALLDPYRLRLGMAV